MLYQYHLGHIDFTTRLKDQQSGSSFENTTPLYPLLTEDLILMLKDFGFNTSSNTAVLPKPLM